MNDNRQSVKEIQHMLRVGRVVIHKFLDSPMVCRQQNAEILHNIISYKDDREKESIDDED